jgi:hypothetical protein
MSDLLLYCVCTVVVSTVVSGSLAIVGAKSRSPYRYVLSMAGVWVAISTLPLSERSWETATFPADPAHFVATLFWSVPFVIAAVIGLSRLVRIGATRNTILLASLAASVVALPVSFLSGIYASCSLGDCL